jgi:hypothetical protein
VCKIKRSSTCIFCVSFQFWCSPVLKNGGLDQPMNNSDHLESVRPPVEMMMVALLLLRRLLLRRLLMTG